MKVHGPLTSGAGSATLGFGSGSSGGVPIQGQQPHPMSVVLYGPRPPRLLDKRKLSASQRKALRKLGLIKDQVAEAMGLPGEAFSLELCEEDNASIDPDGRIAMGIELLEENEQDSDFLAGVIGHEAGHRPWEWGSIPLANLNMAQLQSLHREEEAKADRNAGRILADLGLSPDSLCDFLLRTEGFEGVHSANYYPAKIREEIIRAAYLERKRSLDESGKLFPHLALRAREIR